MCGIYGAFRLTKRAAITKTRLFYLAVRMESRGRDATGIAWTTDDFNVECIKDGDRAQNLAWKFVMGLMPKTTEVSAVIGHSRHSTHGNAGDNTNNHPHFCKYGAKGHSVGVVHNGVIGDRELIAKQNSIELSSECDSEVLASLYAKYVMLGGPTYALSEILKRTLYGSAMYMTSEGIGIHRSGNTSLHIGLSGEVAYVSSEESYLKDIACTGIQEVTKDVPIWFAKSPDGNFYLKPKIGVPVPTKVKNFPVLRM